MSSIDHNADDTARSPDKSIKRAPVVYGKRSDSNSLFSRVAPTDELEQSSEYDCIHGTHTAPSPSPSIHASDSEPSRASDGADPFQFGFRHRLKELDDQFEDHDAQPSKPSVSPSSQAVCAGPSQVKDPQSVSMGTPILSPQARRSSGNASLSPPPTSLRATEERPPVSPPLRRRARGIRNRVLSDSEAEGPSDSSSVSPVRHAITTPHTRSSPTPPTSGDIPMLSRRTKGKAPARDVLPLLFETEPSAVEVPTKPTKGRRSELSARKVKAPTKKERREAALESSRIVANRPVEVRRTQQHKHSFSNFLSNLRRDNIMPPTSGTELPSDPIERFSSPTDKSTRVPPPSSVFGASTGLLASSSVTIPSSPVGVLDVPPPAAADSDEEMPSITAIIQQTSGKKEERLQEVKQIALQRADMSETLGNDSDDDDLLIVKDDMHAVAREEAAQRRLDKAHCSPVKDIALLRRINHPSVRPVTVSPLKFSKQELQELAKPSFARSGNGAKSRLSKNQLDRLMISRHNKNQVESIKRHEAEWVKGGGRLSRDSGNDTQTSLSQKLEAYAEQGLKTAEVADAVGDEASTDESDEEYTPDVRGSESPQPMETDEAEPDDNIVQSLQPIEGDDGEEEVVAPSRRNKSGQRRPRVVLGSDDEGEQPAHHNLPTAQRDSTSSMESHTEDENDKENSARLMYDRSEDKENKAVVRHESSSALTLGSSLRSLHAIEDGVRRGLPLVSVTGFNGTTGSPKEDVRSPLKDISKDEDDPFLSPSSKSPFTERLLSSAARSPPRSCPSTLSLGSPPVLRTERAGRINRLSPDPEINENDPPGVKALQPSFLERLHSQINPEPSSLASLNPLANGGFSQLFSTEDQCLNRPVDGAENDGLSLTLDVGLKPALEVSGALQQKAEAIFEKEQEYVVAAAVQQNDRPKERLYINDHGFLTQTRPEGSSPDLHRMTPFQVSKLVGTQVHTTQAQLLSARSPLRTLSFATSLDFSPEAQPLRRLRKCSASPLQQRVLGQRNSPDAKLNAFNILGKGPKSLSKGRDEKHKKSDFVAVEAEESDEDDMFGFGGPKRDDDEEDDDDQDKVVEGLVDDMVMDAETEAAHLVQEKYREHGEEDDERLQKLHQDAIEGKFRMKRRGLGVGLEDDSDDEDDEDARRIRQRVHKKRRIEGDSLEALGQNEETRAFYNTYHQDLIDEDDEFAHLREGVVMPVDDGDTQTEEPEERETVSVDEIRQRVRELAQNNSEDVEALDPEDTSWIDRSMAIEPDEAFRVKVVEYRRGKSTGRRPNAGPLDFDVERPERPMDDKEREQLQSWAKNQRPQYRGTGRSGNSAAVTGHKKGGSLRSTRLSNSALAVNEPHKAKISRSLLSTVSDRSGKFA